MNQAPAALEVRDVTKRFGDFTAVDNLSLTVNAGETLGLLGPNGAGKSTTIRMAMNIIAPDTGAITILGQPAGGDVKDRVGYLPEERGLYRKMTVETILRYLGRLKGVSGAALRRRVDESLERVNLTQWRKKRVEALSKGMQQKLQVVATLVHEPELVILDEPFSGLDPINREMLAGIIREMPQRGVTVIFSTHVMEQAEAMCDRFVLINRGRKLIEGTLEEVRSAFPTRTAVLGGDGDLRAATQHPLVQQAHVVDSLATVELAEDADPRPLLEHALQHVRLTKFELRRPTLQEIFVHLVESDEGEAAAAEAARAMATNPVAVPEVRS